MPIRQTPRGALCELLVRLEHKTVQKSEQSEQQNKDDEGRQIQQENEILRIIRDVLKHDPQKPPTMTPGKPWVKSEVRKTLAIPHQPFQSVVVFNKAWERLLNNEKIKIVSE